VPYKVPQRVPLAALDVDVVHAAAQAGLQVLGVVAEQIHDHGPRDGSEDGPGVVGDAAGEGLARDHRQAGAGRDGYPGEGEDDAGEDVDDDLLVDRRDLAAVPRAAAEDDVASYQTGDEGVIWACASTRISPSPYRNDEDSCAETGWRKNSPSLPGVGPRYFMRSIVSLYMEANLARLRACVRVARMTRLILCRKLVRGDC